MEPISRRAATEAEAKALASTIRMRILRLCLDEPRTNKELAAHLGANPATVLHHVRTLVKTGFLAPQRARRGPRGSREIPYLSTRKSYWLDTPGAGQEMVEALVTEFRQVVDPSEARIARLGLRLTDQEYEALTRRMGELLDELAARLPDPAGQPYSLFYAVLPDPDREVTPPAAT